jgi:hypothetical protein
MNKYAISFPDLIILEGRIYVLLIHHQPKDAHLVSPRRLCVARGRGDSFYSIATCTEMGISKEATRITHSSLFKK